MQRRRQPAAGAEEASAEEGGAAGPPEQGGWSLPPLLSLLLCLTVLLLGCGALGLHKAGLLQQQPQDAPAPERETAPAAPVEPSAEAAAEAPADGRPRLWEIPQERLPTTQDLEWHVLSTHPRIYIKDDFLSREECEFLKRLVDGRLEPAKVVQETNNKWDTQMQVRNNKQIWLTPDEERQIPLLRHIIKRMHRAARIPDDDAEALQIGRYGVDEKYEMHLDTDPQNDVPRPATMIVYLHEPEAGGETVFAVTPEARGTCMGWNPLPNGTQVYGVKSCCMTAHPERLMVPPKVGRAVLFWNHDLRGEKDPRAEHAACPVQRGEKWIAQRWFRFSPYNKIVHPPDPRFDGLPPLAPHPAGGASLDSQPGRLDVRVLSQKSPRVYLVEDLLSQEECDRLISVAKDVDHFQENGMKRRWLPAEVEATDPVIKAVVKRLHRAALVPEVYGEVTQVGYSEPGAFSQFHLDSFPDGGLVRPLTILVYLDGDGTSSMEGATVFPLGHCKEMQDCCDLVRRRQQDRGGPLAIPPKAGRAVLFASHHLDGALDDSSVHGSCPTGPRGKWVAQRWLRSGAANQLDYGFDPRFEGLGLLSK